MHIFCGMGLVHPLPPPRPATPPPTLHARAIANIEFIRETMENASSFTAVSGWGQFATGATALLAGVVAARQATTRAWLMTWLGQALVSVVIAGWAMQRKARRTRMPLLSRPARKFAHSFAPPMFVGALLTVLFYQSGLTQYIPGMWLLLYGTAVVTGEPSRLALFRSWASVLCSSALSHFSARPPGTTILCSSDSAFCI